jgi:tetratricopeptide (TPR) repeat protein
MKAALLTAASPLGRGFVSFTGVESHSAGREMMTRFDTFGTRLHRLPCLLWALVALMVTFGCTPLSEEGTSITRGDQAFAKGDLEEALAEYRLALTQGAGDSETFARVAHTYVLLGRVDEGREYYAKAVAEDSTLADQALSDFVRLAREEARAGDRYGMASAVETALDFQPGISLEDLALPLAQHYSNVGEYSRALPYFQKTLGSIDPDSLPEVLFQTAVAYDEVGDCESAVIYYEDYRGRLNRNASRSEVNWRLGNCSFELALRSWEDGEDEDALGFLDTLLDVGEPRNRLARGYFLRGEILGSRGECEAAIEAFQEVPVMDPSGSSVVVDSAEIRIDQIRFGGRFDRSFQRLRSGRLSESCFPPGSGVGRPNRNGEG